MPKTTAPTPPATTLDAHLAAVLDGFGGDIDRIEQALLRLKAQRPPTTTNPQSSGHVIVELTAVSRRYKLGRERVGAVQDVSLQIHAGELIAITGPSGSGKSTLLNLIGALDKPDSGTVEVDDQLLTKLNDRRLSEFRNHTVGFVFQFFYLQPFLNLRTNLEVPGMFSRLSRTDRATRIQELAEAVGIADRLEHLPKELSGGQMQRAAIARALLNRPKIILADEPTGNVDRANARAIIALFSEIRERYGTTIIIVTHDPEVAGAADRTITLRDGRII
ncbi:MAG TPA: ABC transporter ATP-binding protein [Candidatus Saccharimonadia bacterium]|nr:ABC transporter ATP-binding protein [Candidatus Saccharimonadia bacterium]